jgi:cobalt-zinc-cadmium efflux system protein
MHVFKNYKSIFSIFLQKAPNTDEFDEFKKKVLDEMDIIKEIHDTHVWSLDGINTYISLHVVIPQNVTTQDIIKIKRMIKEEAEHHSIFHTIIEIEFENEECVDKECNVEINNKRLDTHHHHNH